MHIQVDPQYLVLSWVPSELASQLRLRPVLLDEIERFGCQFGPLTYLSYVVLVENGQLWPFMTIYRPFITGKCLQMRIMGGLIIQLFNISQLSSGSEGAVRS